MNKYAFILIASCLLMGMLFLTECTAPTSISSSPTPALTNETPKSYVAVYYPVFSEPSPYLVREVHLVQKNGNPMEDALYELIKGTPITPGAQRVIPEDTKVLGIEVSSGEAKVNFSRAVLKANVGAELEALGIASIVNTLSEFPEIHRVSFLVEGSLDQEAMDWWGHVGLYEQPFSPNWDLVTQPAVWVISPLPEETIQSPVRIRGKAMVFEAALSGRIKDRLGKVLAEGSTMATKGAPERGDFELNLTFQVSGPEEGTIEIYTISPKDGSEIMEATVPIRLK